eukprot:4746367-Pyramimonas_sp.AAC.1
MEIQCKKLLELVKGTNLPRRWRANRSQGVFYRASTPAVRLVVPDDPAQATTLEWNHRLIDDAGLDKDALPAAFNSLFGETEKVQWSV